MKKIMIMMVMLVAAIAATAQNTKSATQDSTIAALQAENAKLRNDLQATTAVGQANRKGCGALHIDTLKRTITGWEACNGFYMALGGGYNLTKWEVADEGTSGSTGAPVGVIAFGYRHNWLRPEISVAVGGKENIEDREYQITKFKAVVNIDVLRFKKVHNHHAVIDPYIFGGISYNVIKSKKVTGVGDIPYDGNQFRAEAGLGAWIKLGTFGCGRTNVNSYGKNVSLRNLSQLFLDINLSGSYGELSKPRLAADNAQPIMKNFDVTPTVRLVWKF